MFALGSNLLSAVGPGIVQAGIELGSNLIEHQRANHLHKEGILQALRIHEAETQANKEYHR